MPNTLAHIGLNAVATRVFIKRAELHWVYLGVVIPDLPWIIQRAIKFFVPAVDAFDLRLYCVAQSSLLFCLVLSLAFASIAKDRLRCFSILSFGALMHLLLDAMQTKWGNGSVMLAPFEWSPWNIGLFWPESSLTYILTAAGLGYFLWQIKTVLAEPVVIERLPLVKIATACMLLLAYFLVPAVLLSGPAGADAHYVTSLRSASSTEQYIEVDRAQYIPSEETASIKLFTGNSYAASGADLAGEKIISIKGIISPDDVFRITDYHVHSRLRDVFSYFGLALIAMVFVLRGYQFTRQWAMK